MTPAELLLGALSGLLQVVWGVVAKSSPHPLHFMFRMELVSTALALPWLHALFANAEAIPSEFWPIVGAAGICHALFVVLLARTFASQSFSAAHAQSRLAPAFLPAVLAAGEHEISGAAGLGLGLIAIGSVWVALDRPAPWRGVSDACLPASLLAVSAAYWVLDSCGVRMLASVCESPTSALSYVAAYSVIQLPVLFLLSRSALTGDTGDGASARVVSAALLGLASYGLVLGLAVETPVFYIASARQSSLVWAVVMSALIFREAPSARTRTGSFAVLAGLSLQLLD